MDEVKKILDRFSQEDKNKVGNFMLYSMIGWFVYGDETINQARMIEFIKLAIASTKEGYEW